MDSNSGTFNVVSFMDLYRLIEEVQGAIIDNINSIVGDCGMCASLFFSEDSSITQTYTNLGKTFKQANEKADSLFTSLKKELYNYMENTINNEKQSATELEEINTQLNTTASAIDAL